MINTCICIHISVNVFCTNLRLFVGSTYCMYGSIHHFVALANLLKANFRPNMEIV
jgi:hypothetical protein